MESSTHTLTCSDEVIYGRTMSQYNRLNNTVSANSNTLEYFIHQLKIAITKLPKYLQLHRFPAPAQTTSATMPQHHLHHTNPKYLLKQDLSTARETNILPTTLHKAPSTSSNKTWLLQGRQLYYPPHYIKPLAPAQTRPDYHKGDNYTTYHITSSP